MDSAFFSIFLLIVLFSMVAEANGIITGFIGTIFLAIILYAFCEPDNRSLGAASVGAFFCFVVTKLCFMGFYLLAFIGSFLAVLSCIWITSVCDELLEKEEESEEEEKGESKIEFNKFVVFDKCNETFTVKDEVFDVNDAVLWEDSNLDNYLSFPNTPAYMVRKNHNELIDIEFQEIKEVTDMPGKKIGCNYLI